MWCRMVCLFSPFSPFNIPCPPDLITTHAKHDGIGCVHCWLVMGQSLKNWTEQVDMDLELAKNWIWQFYMGLKPTLELDLAGYKGFF